LPGVVSAGTCSCQELSVLEHAQDLEHAKENLDVFCFRIEMDKRKGFLKITDIVIG